MKVRMHFKRESQTVTNYCCRFCGFKVRFWHNIFFDAVTLPLSRLLLVSHALIRHWGVFGMKENLLHLRSAFLYLLLVIPILLLDFIHGILWLLTFPFWWIHEQL